MLAITIGLAMLLYELLFAPGVGQLPFNVPDTVYVEPLLPAPDANFFSA